MLSSELGRVVCIFRSRQTLQTELSIARGVAGAENRQSRISAITITRRKEWTLRWSPKLSPSRRTYFTAGPKEIRAWTYRSGWCAKSDILRTASCAASSIAFRAVKITLSLLIYSFSVHTRFQVHLVDFGASSPMSISLLNSANFHFRAHTWVLSFQ